MLGIKFAFRLIAKGDFFLYSSQTSLLKRLLVSEILFNFVVLLDNSRHIESVFATPYKKMWKFSRQWDDEQHSFLV